MRSSAARSGRSGPPGRGVPVTEAAARAAYREQIDGLLEGGVDLIVLETFSDLEQLLVALEEARRASDVPVIASLTFGEDLVLADGSSPAVAAAALARRGRRRVGVNCGAGPGGFSTHSRRSAGRGRRPAALDHAERRVVAAARGPIHLRRQRRVLR